jgi:hypothetical protein
MHTTAYTHFPRSYGVIKALTGYARSPGSPTKKARTHTHAQTMSNFIICKRYFEVLTATNLKITAFCGISAFNLEDTDRCFRVIFMSKEVSSSKTSVNVLGYMVRVHNL